MIMKNRIFEINFYVVLLTYNGFQQSFIKMVDVSINYIYTTIVIKSKLKHWSHFCDHIVATNDVLM